MAMVLSMLGNHLLIHSFSHSSALAVMGAVAPVKDTAPGSLSVRWRNNCVQQRFDIVCSVMCGDVPV